MMGKYCNKPGCQFDAFLQLQEPLPTFVVDNDSNDTFCLFHTPAELQKKFSFEDEAHLQKLLDAYVQMRYAQNLSIDFTGVVLYNFIFPSEGRHYEKVIFNRAHFIGYPNFDNLDCEELELVDCVFERGGRFKNVKIDHLTFKPKKIKEAVVFETGGYAQREDNLIAVKHDSWIKYVDKFTNHVEGDGQVFFVGCRFENANFMNGMLDRVVFQNCDLTHTYFLNAKIDETEFRNCHFPYNYERGFINEIQGHERYIIFFAPLLSALFFYLWFFQEKLMSNHMVVFDFFYSIMSIIFVFLLMSGIGAWTNSFFYFFNKNINKFKETKSSLNSLRPGFHICTADEYMIFQQFEKLNKSNQDFMEQKKALQRTGQLLSNLYQQLKKNFESKKEIQQAGEFFFSERYVEILSGKKDIFETAILYFHYAVNGFGERFIRPVFWFIVLTFFVSVITTPNIDYISTEATPQFLLKDFNKAEYESNSTYIYKFDVNNTRVISRMDFDYSIYLNNRKYENNATLRAAEMKEKNASSIGFYYASAGVIAFLTPESKKWFKIVTQYGSNIQLLEGVLSWFLIGAFILAVRNRIRRQ